MSEQGTIELFSAEAEEAVIGSVLINAAVFPRLCTSLKKDDFFTLRLSIIWNAMSRLYERKEIIEYITVVEELRVTGKLDEVGGAAYVGTLLAQAGTSMHAEAYAHIVRNLALRRRLLETASKINALAQEDSRNAVEVITNAEQLVSDLSEKARLAQNGGLQSVKDEIPTKASPETIEAVIDSDYADYIESCQAVYRLGLREVDDILFLQKGALHTIAARPRMGKSALLQTAVYYSHLADFVHNEPVQGMECHRMVNGRYLRVPHEDEVKMLPKLAYFSLEMSKRELYNRFYAMMTGLNLMDIMRGKLTKQQYVDYRFAKRVLGSLDNRLLVQSGSVDIATFQAQMRLHKPAIGMLDYLGIAESGLKQNSKREEMAYITRAVKMTAVELDIPIVAAAQINREGASHPTLEHLKESGTVEEDSDSVTFIHRPEVVTEGERPGEADIIVAKQRNGPTGSTRVQFEKSRTLFRDLVVRIVHLNEAVGK